MTLPKGGRKGQFYSIIAILIIIPITVFVVQYVLSQTTGTEVYERVVSDQVHQTERNIEKDLERAILTSGKRAVIGLGDRIIMNGSAYSDASGIIVEMMENGTLYGNESIIMTNNTISNWTSKILSVPVNFIVDMEHSDITIENSGGFHLKAGLKFNISVEDANGIARVEKVNRLHSAEIPLEGMEDPLFPLNTNGLLTRTIHQSPFSYRAKRILEGGAFHSGSCSGEVTFDKEECSPKILVAENASGVNFGCYKGIIIEESSDLSSFIDCYITGNSSSIETINSTIESEGYGEIYLDNVTGSVWHLPLKKELEEGYYVKGSGPDYLKRLEGKLSTSPDSIETFINARDLETYNIPIKENQISLCYLYFSDQDYIGYGVRGLPSWFRINQVIADEYRLADLFEG